MREVLMSARNQKVRDEFIVESNELAKNHYVRERTLIFWKGEKTLRASCIIGMVE